MELEIGPFNPQGLRDWIRRELNVRTFDERQIWKESREYLSKFCDLHDYDPRKCGEEMKKLSALNDVERQKAWDHYYVACQNANADILASYPQPEAHRLLVELTTVEVLKAGHPPPWWHGYGHCETCNFVVLPEGEHLQLKNCPWCLAGSFIATDKKDRLVEGEEQ